MNNKTLIQKQIFQERPIIGVTFEEMSELKIVFNLFDSTSKGYLEAREFRECLRNLGLLKTERYNLHYKDASGGIIPKKIEKFDFVEFVEFVRD